jgi:aspartate racemase
MPNLTPHIGIVGCSAEGAALCYRTICLEGEALFGTHRHPDVSMHTHSLGAYMVEVKKDNWDGAGDLMLSSAEKLYQAGAEILICPDNTIHQSYDYVLKKSPLPWLHIAEVVVKKAMELNLKHLGILGTKYLMEGPVYKKTCEKLGVKYSIPDKETRLKINEIIFEELVKGVIKEESKKYFREVIDRLKNQGCDGVVLGCTEIPLIVTERSSSLPTLDSTRLLARAALSWAKEK